MISETRKHNEGREQEPRIVIKKSSDAPAEVKQNPFYDSEIWGRALSPDDIYLPDSDEALSFAIAAHEIGHLVESGQRDEARIDNFEATRAEEQRAWDGGWAYLRKYLLEYYQDNPEVVAKIHQAFGRIKNLLMRGTDLSKEMYLERGVLDNASPDEIDVLVKEKQKRFFSEKGDEFKELFARVKEEKIGVRPNWEKLAAAVSRAVKEIIKDNEKLKKV